MESFQSLSCPLQTHKHTHQKTFFALETSINLHMNSYTTVILMSVSSLIERGKRGGENNEPNNRALSE